MGWPTMEQMLAASRQEIEELQNKLDEKEMAVRGLEVAILHHVQKAEELECILEAKECEGGLETLHAKERENDGLVVEVEDLRDQLQKSSQQQEILEAQLKIATDKSKKLAVEVDDMRDQLQKSSKNRDTVEAPLKVATDKSKRLAVEVQDLKDQLKTASQQREVLETPLKVAMEKSKRLADEVQDLRDQLKTGSKQREMLEEQLRLATVKLKKMAVDVEEKRDQLKTSSKQRKNLEEELNNASDRLNSMEGDRRMHQRVLLGIGDIVRMLGRIGIDKVSTIDGAPDWSDPVRSLNSIKLEICALEEDRQRILQNSHHLQTELLEKSNEIDSYRNQTGLLKATKLDTDRLVLQNKKLKEDGDEKDAYIKSLEQALAYAKRHSGTIPHNIECEYPAVPHDDDCENSQDTFVEVQLQEDGSTLVLQSMASVSRLTLDHSQYDVDLDGHEHAEKVMSSYTSLESSAGDHETPPSDQIFYEVRSNFYEKVLEEEVSHLKEDLQKSRLEEATTKKKQDIREKMLRDVIFQYKELQKELDTTTALLRDIQVDRRGDIDPARDASGKQNDRGIFKKKSASERRSAALLEESSTFDTDDMSAVSSTQAQSTSDSTTRSPQTLTLTQTLPQSRSLTVIPTRSHTLAQENSSSTWAADISLTRDDDYRQMEMKLALLEHEYDDAVARITNLEEDLTVTRRQLADVQANNLVKHDELVELKNQYDHLQSAHQAAMERTEQLQDDLEYAREQGRISKEQRDDREKGLWDVIDQYKKLAVENEEKLVKMQGAESQLGRTQALMQSVQNELALTQRQIKRKDLIYDHIRMKKQIEDYKIQVENLQRNLTIAKSKAAVNKEEGKGTRCRLVGCHFHHKKLQTQYDDVLIQKAKLQKDLDRAELQMKTQKKQHNSWMDKLTNLREKREEAAIRIQKLGKENTELKAYCNELLNLASKSIQAL